MKGCFKCKKTKPLSGFYKDPHSKDGHGSRCKDCCKIYRVENREYYLAYNKQYNVKYNTEHRDHRLAYNAEHREEMLRQAKEWNRTNHERMQQYQHLYNRSPRGKAVNKRGNHKRRALLAACAINDLTTPQTEVLLQGTSSNCPICIKPFNNNGRKKSIDHIIPLSKRGNNTLSNIQVICLSCNSKKNNKLITI